MTEWVLIIWVINCTFGGCVKAGIQNFAIYPTQQECEQGLKNWTIRPDTRNMTPEYRRKRSDRDGECLDRPALVHEGLAPNE